MAKKTEQIAYSLSRSEYDWLLVAKSDKGICAVFFGKDEADLVTSLQLSFKQAEIVRDDAALALAQQELNQLIANPAYQPNLVPDCRGSDFQQKVWAALKAIPVGETRSYSALAEALAMPKAVRAVASACAANKLALLIPCHRVVRSTGELSGYRWGVPIKRALLIAEAKAVSC